MLRTTFFSRHTTKKTAPTPMCQSGQGDLEALLGDTALLHRARELNVLRDTLAAARDRPQPPRRR